MKKQGLSGAALKWTALISMLLDHVGLALVWFGLIVPAEAFRGDFLIWLYRILRSVGRLAFPIFCFLLAEGFRHTRSRGKYLLRLLLFALASEIPYDLALKRSLFDISAQNVLFTMALGLAALWGWEELTRGEPGRCGLPRLLAASLCVGAAMTGAWLLRTDYYALGVLLILIFHWFRENIPLRDLGAALTLCAMVWPGGAWWIEIFGILALPLLRLYNGERGRQSKGFFYAFYPAHLLLLYLLREVFRSG